jgi:hypothetical protein
MPVVPEVDVIEVSSDMSTQSNPPNGSPVRARYALMSSLQKVGTLLVKSASDRMSSGFTPAPDHSSR